MEKPKDIRRRRSDTACAVPGVTSLHNWHAERVVLRGLMRDSRTTANGLAALSFDKGDIYFDTHQRAYDLLMYLAVAGVAGPCEMFAQMQRSGEWLNFSTRRDAVVWLADVYFVDYWMSDIASWSEPLVTVRGMSNDAWAALAAAAKVRHLASRRHAYYSATELIRDALSPTSDALDLFSRGDDMEGL